jgi:hypothetical protein
MVLKAKVLKGSMFQASMKFSQNAGLGIKTGGMVNTWGSSFNAEENIQKMGNIKLAVSGMRSEYLRASTNTD